MLKDKDIRLALLEEISNYNKGKEHRIVEELAVCDGDARVDLALINGKLCGYEIKSDKDTLERLPNQIDSYNKTFDNITIVVGRKYEKKIKKEVPLWWGIKVAYKNKNELVCIEEIRASKKNKTINTRSVIELLWRQEIATLLKSKGITGISSKNRRELRDIAIKAISPNEIINYTRETLKTREGWRSD